MFSLYSVYVPFEGFGKLTFTPRSPYCITLLYHLLRGRDALYAFTTGDGNGATWGHAADTDTQG